MHMTERYDMHMTERYDPEKLVGILEVARQLGVSHGTVRKLIFEKRLPAFRVRGVYRVRKRAIDRYLEENRTDAE